MNLMQPPQPPQSPQPSSLAQSLQPVDAQGMGHLPMLLGMGATLAGLTRQHKLANMLGLGAGGLSIYDLIKQGSAPKYLAGPQGSLEAAKPIAQATQSTQVTQAAPESSMLSDIWGMFGGSK